MQKKKGSKDFLCYIGLFILIVLLLLPLGLQLFGKNLYEKKEEEKKDVIEILSCITNDASISSTFLNGEPQNLLYKIKGDYTNIKEDEKKDSKETKSSSEDNAIEKKDLLDYIKEYSQIEYLQDEEMTSFRTNMADLKQVDDYMIIFNNLTNQQKYYESLTFSCQTITS